MVDDTRAASVPYVPFRTFLNLLDRLQSGGIPQHIDRHYWGGFLAGSTGQQVMAAFKFFGLIDPETNESTPMLERLVNPGERKALLAELLNDRYASLVTERGVDFKRIAPGNLEKAFGEQFRIEGETRRKAVTFFVHASQYAEVQLSPLITAKSRQRRASTSSPGRSRAKSAQVPPPLGEKGEQPAGRDELAQDTGPYAILHAWLRYLPPDGRWTRERRDQWFAALQANVDFLVAVQEDEEAEFDGYFDEGDGA